MSAALRDPDRTEAGGIAWHVERAGAGPVALLLHGTGASSHSWAGLLPHLAARFTVLAPDLPGMGRTAAPPRAGLTLPGMARLVAALMRRLEVLPVLVVGHSAGAAVAARMALDGAVAPARIAAVNGALLPIGGWAGEVFGPLARLMAEFPGLADVMAWRARDGATVRRLLDDTGSRLAPAQVEAYARLFRDRRHVAATLSMMAAWDLPSLARDLPHLRGEVLLVVGQGDRTIRPTEARRVRALLPEARVVMLPRLGHLAHEEDPRAVAEAILS